MTKAPDCPMCQTPGPWESRDADRTYCYKGQQFSLTNVAYSECRECGFDLVLPHQKRKNEARARDEHRRIDGLLTGAQIREIRKRLGLTQARAAQLIGGGANAFSKYERGEVTQSVAMNQLLLLLDALPDALAILSARSVSFSVQSEQLLPPTTIQVPEAMGERLISNPSATRVSLEHARTYRVGRLAA